MAFETLTEKLQNAFANMRKKGRLTEEDVKLAMKEVKMALLEADVNFKVVRTFVKSVQEKAVGQDVMNGLNPAQMVIKIVRDEMVQLLGEKAEEIPLSGSLPVIMMAGLQGAGKTTTAAKLAGKYKSSGKRVLLAAGDVYRPAAIRQLEINAEKVGVDVFSLGTGASPVEIAKAAYAHAKEKGYNLLIIDTAGRLQIDEEMMQELVSIKEAVEVSASILVVDAMTGQEAVEVAKTFSDKVGIDGCIPAFAENIPELLIYTRQPVYAISDETCYMKRRTRIAPRCLLQRRIPFRGVPCDKYKGDSR